jgi:hypothetical protein
MDPEQLSVVVESGRNFEGHLEMVDRFLWFALVTIYVAENTVSYADQKLLAFLREEIDCADAASSAASSCLSACNTKRV